MASMFLWMGLAGAMSTATARAQEPPGGMPPTQATRPEFAPGQNPMQQMANPTGPGRLGPYQFSSSEFDGGNLAWMLASLFTIALAIPGFVLFYGGYFGVPMGGRLARGCVLLVAILCLAWGLWIYTLGGARNLGSAWLPRDMARESAGFPLIGGWDHAGLRGVGSQVRADAQEYAQRRFEDPVPHIMYLHFHMLVFAATAMPLVVVLWERLSLGRLLVFLLAWGTLVFAPIFHWVWGFGWLSQAATLDFAGGAAMHVCAGFSGLALALVLSDRVPRARVPQEGVMWCGLVLVWLGLLAMHAGCGLSASAQGTSALLSAQLAACSGLLGWAGIEWLRDGRSDLGKTGLGAVAGLAAIAAGSGYVPPQSAIVIGLLGGAVAAVTCRSLADRVTGSPPLLIFAAQGVAGVVGLLLAGVFVSPSVAFGPDGAPVMGLLGGAFKPLRVQAVACLATAGWAFLVVALLAAVVRFLPGSGRAAGDEPSASA
jgi:Amt family ammonium transporter